MKKFIALILIFSFSFTFIGNSFAEEPPKESPPASEVSPKATVMEAPGSPQSPASPPATQMNSAGLSQMQNFSNNVIDDHVDPVSGALVVKQTDLVIPGRGGLDLVISRSYNSRRFSTPAGLLSPAQQYFISLFDMQITEEVHLVSDRRTEEAHDRSNAAEKTVSRLRALKPSEIIDKANKSKLSTSYSGLLGHGWGFSFAGTMRVITFSGPFEKDKFPAGQVILQYGERSARFTENFERTGIYYSQEKGNNDIVKADGAGYSLIGKDGVKYYFDSCIFYNYYGYSHAMFMHDKTYLLTKIEDAHGNTISINNQKYGKENNAEIIERHESSSPISINDVRLPEGILSMSVSVSIPIFEKGEVTAKSLIYYETAQALGIAEWVNPWAAVIIIAAYFLEQIIFGRQTYTDHEHIGYKFTPYRPTQIIDTCGRKVSIKYNSNTDDAQISEIDFSDQGGSSIAFKYFYDTDNLCLKEVVPPKGNSTKYEYTFHTQELTKEYDDKGYLLTNIVYSMGGNSAYSYYWYNPKEDQTAKVEEMKGEDAQKFSSYVVKKRTISSIGNAFYNNSGGFIFNSTRDNALAGVVWCFNDSAVLDPLSRETKHIILNGVPVRTLDPKGYVTDYEWDYKNFNLRDLVFTRGSNVITTQYREFDDFGNFRTQIEGGDNNTLSDDRTTHFEFVYEKNPVYKDNGMTSLVYRQWIDKNGIFKEAVNEYDSGGKGNLLKRIEKVNGKEIVTLYEYDKYGNVIKQTDPNGAVTVFEYSPEYKGAYLTKITKVVDGKTLIATKTYYFNTGLLKSETDFNGNTTSYQYDQIGRMLKKTNPDGTFVSYTYNDAENEIEVRDERGEMTTYKYDTLGRLSSIKFADGGSVSYQYNAVSKVIAITDRAGRKTGYSYDELDRISRVTYPDGAYTEYQYDDSHNTTAVEDALGNTSKFKYDNFGNLVDVTQADGERALYDYDAIGDMTSVTDPRLLTTKHFYDSGGRLLRTEYPDGSNYEFEYDKLGNPVKKADAKGERINYTYDEMGRITGSGYRDAGCDVIRGYDSSVNGKGLLSTMKDPSGLTTFNFDKRGRIVEKIKMVGPNTFRTAFEYDAAGNLLSVKDPVGEGKTGYEFDVMNRVVEVVRDQGLGTGGQGVIANYKYNAANTINSITFKNGNAVKYTYDLRDRVDTLTILDRNGNQILKYDYDYDAVGNLTRNLISPSESFAYGYDKVYRLTNVQFPSEGDHVYKYDPAGNRTAFKYAYGDINYSYEQKSNALDYYNVNLHGKVDLSYDQNGNLVKEEKFQGDNPGDFVNYTYDPEDRLIEISSPEVKMVYDGNGMRAAKTVNGETLRLPLDGLGVAQGETTLYHYDLANNVICETDDAGKVKATYVYANGMRVCRIDPVGKMFFFLNDPLGSPIMITDENGNAVQRYVYDPFGTVILSKGTSANKYTYTGKEYDSESGLMYYGARFYDPKIGRFITRDIAAPDWGNGQALNRYVYCLNNPLFFIDPDGKKVEQVSTIFYVDLGESGKWPAVHTYTVLTPDFPEEFRQYLIKGENFFIITGMEEGSMLKLLINYEHDISTYKNEAFVEKYTPLPKQGQTDTQLIKDYLKFYKAFPKEGIPYVVWSTNCNSVTRGLALAVGARGVPEDLIYGFHWGWSTPIDFTYYYNQQNSNLGYFNLGF